MRFEHRPRKIFSETNRRLFAEGESQGEAKGEAKALLKILAQRGLALTEAQRDQILACSGIEAIERWIDRALAGASIDELLA